MEKVEKVAERAKVFLLGRIVNELVGADKIEIGYETKKGSHKQSTVYYWLV